MQFFALTYSVFSCNISLIFLTAFGVWNSEKRNISSSILLRDVDDVFFNYFEVMSTHLLRNTLYVDDKYLEICCLVYLFWNYVFKLTRTRAALVGSVLLPLTARTVAAAAMRDAIFDFIYPPNLLTQPNQTDVACHILAISSQPSLSSKHHYVATFGDVRKGICWRLKIYNNNHSDTNILIFIQI